MPNTKDIKLGDKVFCLYKGEPGTGKTRAAGSFPKPFVFDFDGRLATLRLAFPEKDIAYESYYNNFDAAMRKLEEFTSYCPYETVIFDSLTSFVRTTLNHMIRSRGGKGDLTRGGLRVPQIEDYGGETAALVQLTDALRVIYAKGTNVVLIAHVVTTTERNIKKQEVTEMRQLLTGGKKIAAELPAYYDECYHFFTQGGFDGKPEYKVYTANAGDDWAKTSLPLPQVITWTNLNFYDKLQGFIKEKEGKL
jgi:hypothetical protein